MRIHLAILRCASWLVPGDQRAEWLAEWSAELWQVRQRGEWRTARFCMGSFRDALWLRRNGPPDERPWLRLESPGRCLGGLGLAAAACALLALRSQRPGSPLWPLGPPLFVMAQMAVASLPAVLGTTSLRLGDYPASRYGWRWAFFAGKVALLMLLVFFGALDLLPFMKPWVCAQSMLIGYIVAFRWALVDQRRRCPQCLRLLKHPAPIGEPSHVFLEWYGTEFACAKGHGLLHVPEIPTVSFRTQTWMRLDRSWRALFS